MTTIHFHYRYININNILINKKNNLFLKRVEKIKNYSIQIFSYNFSLKSLKYYLKIFKLNEIWFPVNEK